MHHLPGIAIAKEDAIVCRMGKEKENVDKIHAEKAKYRLGRKKTRQEQNK